jgi:hypothetical protein
MGKRCPIGVSVSCAVTDPAGQSYGQPYSGVADKVWKLFQDKSGVICFDKTHLDNPS